MDCSLPGSCIREIVQARILEWVVFPTPAALCDPGIEPTSPALQADSLLLYHLESPLSNNYMFIWMGKNKESDSIPCRTENQRGPGLSLLCTIFSFSRLQFVLASVKSVQDICIYMHIYIWVNYEDVCASLLS